MNKPINIAFLEKNLENLRGVTLQSIEVIAMDLTFLRFGDVIKINSKNECNWRIALESPWLLQTTKKGIVSVLDAGSEDKLYECLCNVSYHSLDITDHGDTTLYFSDDYQLRIFPVVGHQARCNWSLRNFKEDFSIDVNTDSIMYYKTG